MLKIRSSNMLEEYLKTKASDTTDKWREKLNDAKMAHVDLEAEVEKAMFPKDTPNAPISLPKGQKVRAPKYNWNRGKTSSIKKESEGLYQQIRERVNQIKGRNPSEITDIERLAEAILNNKKDLSEEPKARTGTIIDSTISYGDNPSFIVSSSTSKHWSPSKPLGKGEKPDPSCEERLQHCIDKWNLLKSKDHFHEVLHIVSYPEPWPHHTEISRLEYSNGKLDLFLNAIESESEPDRDDGSHVTGHRIFKPRPKESASTRPSIAKPEGSEISLDAEPYESIPTDDPEGIGF